MVHGPRGVSRKEKIRMEHVMPAAFIYPTVKAAHAALTSALKDYHGSRRTAAERWGRPRSPGVDPNEAVRTLRAVYHNVAPLSHTEPPNKPSAGKPKVRLSWPMHGTCSSATDSSTTCSGAGNCWSGKYEE